MCLFKNQLSLPYLSCWCALDDVTLENGCIRLIPFSNGDNGKFSPDDLEDITKRQKIIEIQKGSILIFSSRLWHYSGPNFTNASRRAFYCQYSKSIIRASQQDDNPLSFAIPCTPSKTAPNAGGIEKVDNITDINVNFENETKETKEVKIITDNSSFLHKRSLAEMLDNKKCTKG